jgi:poly(A) polymerase
LDKMVKQFVYQISIQRGLPDAIARDAGGKIFTFGSFRLGVHNPGSDIDTLCVVPRHVQREDFFDLMYRMLLEREEVTDVTVGGWHIVACDVCTDTYKWSVFCMMAVLH